MENKTIRTNHKLVCEKLSQKRIKEVLSTMGNLIRSEQLGNLVDAHYDIEYSYKNLLKYTVEGANDPERQKIYIQLLRSSYNLSDQLFSALSLKYSNDYVYEKKRECNRFAQGLLQQIVENYYDELNNVTLLNESGKNLSIPENITAKLFNHLWISLDFQKEEIDLLKKVFNDDEVSWIDKSVFITAITTSLLGEFQKQKLLLLFDLCYQLNEQLSQRALTGLILVLLKYDQRLYLYPEIGNRLMLMEENTVLVDNVLVIFTQLIRTRETEKISNKLNEEILPEVAKIQPHLRDKLDLDNMIGESFVDEENPEWEDFFKDSPELMNKLEELTELQLEGADVFLSTFKALKHFSFFNVLHNWFVPFHLKNDQLQNALSGEETALASQDLQQKICDSGFLCNSDKYSLFLAVPHMPSFQKDMMGKMFEQQMDQMDEIEKDELVLNPGKKRQIISNQYIQDLYRFYKIHPMHHQFEDVFSWRMDLHNKWFYHQLIKDSAKLRQIGEYFFKKEYFEEAKEVFQILLLEKDDDLELIQKCAYSLQKTNEIEEALRFYQKADLIDPKKNWTLKKMALCSRYLMQNEQALNYYLESERLNPDDLHTQSAIGHCLFELKNYKKALEYYFKVAFLDPKNEKVWRPIAWCSFMTKNLDQAEKYYNKLLVVSDNRHDMMNIGHVLWCKNQRNEALSYYQNSVVKSGASLDLFIKSFNDDKQYLVKNGVHPDDIPIMIDQLRYLLDE